jgi:hypothetical protein
LFLYSLSLHIDCRCPIYPAKFPNTTAGGIWYDKPILVYRSRLQPRHKQPLLEAYAPLPFGKVSVTRLNRIPVTSPYRFYGPPPTSPTMMNSYLFILGRFFDDFSELHTSYRLGYDACRSIRDSVSQHSNRLGTSPNNSGIEVLQSCFTTVG